MQRINKVPALILLYQMPYSLITYIWLQICGFATELQNTYLVLLTAKLGTDAYFPEECLKEYIPVSHHQYSWRSNLELSPTSYTTVLFLIYTSNIPTHFNIS